MPPNNTRPDLLATIEDLGFRVTTQRREVTNLLNQKQEGFSAEEICHQLPDVGRATVYRTIQVFLKAGVLCKLALLNGAPKYSLARAEHHHHTICVKCGTVGEFRDSTVERLLRAIGSDVSGKIVGHRIELYITCRDCLDRLDPKLASDTPSLLR